MTDQDQSTGAPVSDTVDTLLAHSLPDARAIADELTERSVNLNLGGAVHDPTPIVEAHLVAHVAGAMTLPPCGRPALCDHVGAQVEAGSVAVVLV